MTSKHLPTLLQQTREGNFTLVNSTIVSQKLELDHNSAGSIIILCCRIFYKNDEPIFEENDLYQLLLTCKQFIKTASHDVFVSCLQSLYFIVKYWLKQEKYEFVLGITDLVLPQFPISWKNDKLVKLYNSFSIIIHNAITLLQLKNSKNYGQLYCQFCTLSLQMMSIHSTNIVLANTAYSYFKATIFLEVDIDSQNNCYLAVLRVLMDSEDTKTVCNLGDIYSAIIKVLDIIIINLFKRLEFNKIGEYIETIILAVRKLPNSKIYCRLFNILYNSSQLVIKLEDNLDHSELFVSNVEKCLQDIKFCLNSYNNTVEFGKLFNLLVYQIYSNIVRYYENVSLTVWTKFMEERVQLVICKLLASTGKFVSQIKGDCRFCAKCKVKNNLNLATVITCLAGNFLTTSLKKQTFVSNSMCHYVCRCLEYCCDFIKILHSKGCSQWKSIWTPVATVMYRIGCKLYSIKQNECCNYFELLIKNMIHLEGISVSTVFKGDVLRSAFEILAEINIQNFQFKKALMYSAIAVFVSTDPTKGYKWWTKTKAKSKDHEIEGDNYLQDLTVVCVLQLYEIKDLFPDLNLHLKPEVRRILLMDELAMYKKVWPCKRPMLAAFRKLSNVADSLTVVKVAIQTWEENIESAPTELLELLNEITSKFDFEIEQNIESKDESQIAEEKFYLALLYNIQYYLQIRIVKKKMVDDIDSTVIPEENPLPSHEMPKNPNDKCDIVTSYSRLKLNKHLKIMELLSKVLTILNHSLSNCTSQNIIKLLEQHNVFVVVEKIAYEFRLHCDLVQTVEAWFLCLKISRLVNNNLCTLQSISFLIEATNMDSKVINTLLIEAKNLENDLTKCSSPEIWAVLTTYHINKSIMLYRHQNMEAGFKEYEQAVECFLNIGENKDELLEIRLDFLHTWYLKLPCSFQMEGHDVFSLSKSSKVCNKISNYLKTTDHSSFRVAIFFEVYEAVVQKYRWMYLPREIRCYCKDVVTFAQGLVVPFQAAYFLVELAHADLQSIRLDDCQVKLNGLSDLLCLENNTKNLVCTEAPADIAVIKEDIDVSKLVDNFAEIMLDCPSTEYKCTASAASPVLFKKRFQRPSFIRHSVECDCFYCVSVEYKILVLEYINLEAQLLIHNGNTAAAIACFSDGVELYNSFTKDDSFKTKITKHLSCYPLRDWKILMCISIGALLLNYANCLLRTDDVKKAEWFNQKIFNLVSKTKTEYCFIYNEALLQKYNIITSIEVASVGVNHLSVNPEYSNPKNLQDIPKTPENKQTKIVLTTSHSPRPNSPPKRRLRKIKCDFSDQPENDHNKIDKQNKSKKKNAEISKIFDLSEEKNNIKDKKNSVQHNIYETPTPTSSAITVCKSVATIKNTKPVLQEIPMPLTQSSLPNNNESCCDDENSLCIIPSSPNAYTPNTLHISTVLKSRTELLTKKLKKSPKNKGLRKDVCDNALETANTGNDHGITARPVKANICKNLMSELCDAETNIGTKQSYKKKSKNIKPATSELTDNINTRRTTRTNSKVINK